MAQLSPEPAEDTDAIAEPARRLLANIERVVRLLVTQTAPHTSRFEWSFQSSTAQCRPAWISLRVFGPSPPEFGPNDDLKVTGLRGVYIMTVPDFFTVVRAGAVSNAAR